MTTHHIRLNRPQTWAVSAMQPGNTVCLPWGRGTGKSWIQRFGIYRYVAQYDGVERKWEMGTVRGVRFMFLMPTLKQFKDVHWDGIEDELTGDGIWAHLGAKLDGQRGSIEFPGGSVVKPFSTDTSRNAKRARGFRCDGIPGDECDDIPAAVWDGIATPCLSAGWSLRMRWPAGTPTNGRTGLLWRSHEQGRIGKLIRAGKAPENILERDHKPLGKCYSLHATYKDCPETVDEEAVSLARATMPEATFNREWRSDFDAGEGNVLPFDDELHIKDPGAAKFSEYIVGVDWGYVDPGVYILIGIIGHGKDAIAWAIDEIYKSGEEETWWNSRAMTMKDQGIRRFWCDPSQPARISALVNLGVDAQKADNDIQGGLGRIIDMMGKRLTKSGKFASRFYVSPKCTNLIREMGLYKRKQRMDGTFAEDPVDRHNHTIDAVRYALVERFGRHLYGKHIV